MSEHRTDHNCAGADCATCLSRELAAAQAENERLRSALTTIEELAENACGEDATDDSEESMMSVWLEAKAALRSVEKGKDGGGQMADLGHCVTCKRDFLPDRVLVETRFSERLLDQSWYPDFESRVYGQTETRYAVKKHWWSPIKWEPKDGTFTRCRIINQAG